MAKIIETRIFKFPDHAIPYMAYGELTHLTDNEAETLPSILEAWESEYRTAYEAGHLVFSINDEPPYFASFNALYNEAGMVRDVTVTFFA